MAEGVAEPGTGLRQRLRDKAFWLTVSRAVLALALTVWLAWLAADTLWLLVSGPSEPIPEDESLPRVEASGENRQGGLDMAQVRDWSLFGTWEQQAGEDSEQRLDAPETRLQLELHGIFQTGDSEHAGAIIAEKGGDGELFRPGDRVPGNATLEEIYRDRVILRRQGQLEALKLKEPGLSGAGFEQVSSPEPSRERDSQAERRDEQRDDGSVDVPGGPADDLEKQRKRIISGMGLESTDNGYVIGGGAPAELLDRAGLQPGDVIVSVNGHEVGEEEADLAALQEYHQTGSATVVVQRGAQRFTVSVPP